MKRLFNRLCLSGIIKLVMLALPKHTNLNDGTAMVDVKQVASYFIQRSSELQENDLTNLKLQKILFYTQAEAVKNAGKAVFNEDIKAWKLGPVVQSVYDWLRGCGAYPITTFDVNVNTSKLDSKTETFLNKVWEMYSIYSAAYLVNKTHESGSPWDIVYNKKHKLVIDLDILKETKLQSTWSK